MSYTLGVDLSRYQAAVDFDRLVDDGVKVVIIKATQGMAVDPMFDRNRGEAEKRNLLWGAYHWVLPGDTEAAITHCVEQVLSKGDVLALDWEQAGVAGDVVERDMEIAEDALRREGLLYRGFWPPAPITPKLEALPWWYPQYPQDPNSLPRVPLWDGTGEPDWSKECFIWQFTGSGRLAGLETAIDLNRILCPFALLTAWWKTGRWSVPIPPQPAPAPPAPSFSGRLLQLNGSGPEYGRLQAMLNLVGGYHLMVDSHMGPLTQAALIDFQKKHGLDPDGVAGPATEAALAAA